MTDSSFNRATHFSLVWASVLAVLTLVEWRSLERDPLSEKVFLPFIERDISLSRVETAGARQPVTGDDDLPRGVALQNLQTTVQLEFNGPLFLLYFCLPIVAFHLLGLLFARLGRWHNDTTGR